MWSLAEWCAAFVGAVFIFSSTQKAVDWNGWLSLAARLGVSKSISLVVAPLEAIIGVALLTQLWPVVAATGSLIVLVVFSVFIASLLARGLHPPCACFGSSRSRPISWKTLARNVAFIAINCVALLGSLS